MLVIGLPLVIIFGTVIGAQMFPQFTLWEACLMCEVSPFGSYLGRRILSALCMCWSCRVACCIPPR